MRLEKLQSSDNTICKLNGKEFKQMCDILEQHQVLNICKRKANRAAQKLYAMQTLFWDHMMSTNEICETSTLRGKTLAIRVDQDGDFVVVETTGADELGNNATVEYDD